MPGDQRAGNEPVPQDGFDAALVASAGPRVMVENRVKQKSELLADQHERETDIDKSPGHGACSPKSPNTRLVKSAMRTTEIPDRRHAMIRLGAGDWLLPSNDRKMLWRFVQHRDGTAYGLVDVPFEDKVFWRALYMSMEQAEAMYRSDQFADQWSSVWHEADWYLPSRKAAIEVAMRRDAERTRHG